MKSGITRRWLRGSLLITVIAVAMAETLFIYLYSQSYYGSVRQSMVTRFSSMTGQLQMYTGETDEDTAAARSRALRHMVEQFGDKDKYEFMLLDGYGSVIATSSGTSASGIVSDKDFSAARASMTNIGSASYTTATGERVMAVCMIVPYAAEDVTALRLVTSLTLVDNQLKHVLVFSLVIVAAILCFTILSGLYFIRSIVNPLGAMEKTAASIAEGDLAVRLPAKGDARDEVDRLSVSINRMAEGLAKTEQMKSEFISSVSHELRTPLTSIKGWVETMEAINDPTDENYRKGLSIIGSETDRLYNMVEELLDFSRLQNGRLTVKMQLLDLVAETTDAVLFLEPRCEQNALTLDYNEPEAAIPVQADPDRLRQVFVNIMDNAVKYSVLGGKITVKVWAGEKKAFVEVMDQGRGIPPEDLENVKAKFYKGRNSVRGSGIGLALVDEIMNAMNGTLDLRSTLGKGTVVTLSLPLAVMPKPNAESKESK
ncbi:MAG: HAMP domain-containing histidine kinase [Faecalibacterium sp.]|jgi:signal transduction histidine kinase|nr:HAMP domain-containing histidine kinase [Faecalibacterium sp.]